jgi:hypothetical protein
MFCTLHRITPQPYVHTLDGVVQKSLWEVTSELRPEWWKETCMHLGAELKAQQVKDLEAG